MNSLEHALGVSLELVVMDPMDRCQQAVLLNIYVVAMELATVISCSNDHLGSAPVYKKEPVRFESRVIEALEDRVHNRSFISFFWV